MNETVNVKVFKNFQTCLKQRSLVKMNKNLYEFLHLYCGFIAHYNIAGFKYEYSGREFLRFLEMLISDPSYGYQDRPEIFNTREALKESARIVINKVGMEFKEESRIEELTLLEALAKKHNITIEKTEIPFNMVKFDEIKNGQGQLELIF